MPPCARLDHESPENQELADAQTDNPTMHKRGLSMLNDPVASSTKPSALLPLPHIQPQHIGVLRHRAPDALADSVGELGLNL